jgi:hypothetical protein
MPQPSVPERDLSALIVVGDDDTRDSGDEVLEEQLESLGFNVNVIEDVEAQDEDDPEDFGLVIVSSSSSSGNLEDEFRNENVPVLVMDAQTFEDMRMTDEEENNSGQEQGNLINIVNESHPLASGLKGQIAVSNTNSGLQWGKPEAAATVVATLATDPSRATIFFYDEGAQMAGGVAPHRRTGFFATEQLQDGEINRDGDLLLQSAILWTWSRTTTPPPVVPPVR